MTMIVSGEAKGLFLSFSLSVVQLCHQFAKLQQLILGCNTQQEVTPYPALWPEFEEMIR